jgi:CheY-like chemotaxis protein
LQVYRPTVIVVDVGLPDGSGLDLIAEMAQAVPRVPVILGTSGDDFAENATLAAGADGFLAKPVTSLAAFQSAVLSRLPRDRQPVGPRSLNEAVICPDPMAYHDDLAHVADVLTGETDGKTLDYVAQFVRGVAHSADDTVLADAATALRRARAMGEPVATDTARIAGLVQQRLERKRAI